MAKYIWTLEIEADEDLVADGFELTHDRAKRMVEKSVPLAHMWQTEVRIISAPNPADIRRVQGFPVDELPADPVAERAVARTAAARLLDTLKVRR